MIVYRQFIFVLVVIVFQFTSCELESVDYPPEPFIEFVDLKVLDTIDLLDNLSRLNTIHFYVIDGDGDIGPINHPDYIGNCYLQLFYEDSGKYKMDTNLLDTVQWPTIPYVGELGQDKALKADIFIENEFNTEPQKSYSNFFYLITVFDMSLNQSNTISTDTIIFKP